MTSKEISKKNFLIFILQQTTSMSKRYFWKRAKKNLNIGTRIKTPSTSKWGQLKEEHLLLWNHGTVSPEGISTGRPTDVTIEMTDTTTDMIRTGVVTTGDEIEDTDINNIRILVPHIDRDNRNQKRDLWFLRSKTKLCFLIYVFKNYYFVHSCTDKIHAFIHGHLTRLIKLKEGFTVAKISLYSSL